MSRIRLEAIGPGCFKTFIDDRLVSGVARVTPTLHINEPVTVTITFYPDSFLVISEADANAMRAWGFRPEDYLRGR